MSTIPDAIYINTAPGRACMFSPPDSLTDYRTWLIARHNITQGSGKETGYCYGIAQKINSIMYKQSQSKTPLEIYTHGPHATAAAEALTEISHGLLQIDVIEKHKGATP
jgi:hypothetical protein